MDRNSQADPKLIEIFEQVRYEPKWQSLRVEEKLELIHKLQKAFGYYRAMERERELDSFNAEFMMENISARGKRRTLRLIKFADKTEKAYFNFVLDNAVGKDKTKRLLEMWKKTDTIRFDK